MTWTYSGDPSSSDKDEVRFYLGDVTTTDQILSDEEIQFYVDKLALVFGNNLATASYLADLIAGRYAREVSISADGVSVGAQELQDKFTALAKSLRAQWRQLAGVGGGPDVGGILWGEEIDPTTRPLVFGKGMDDNWRSGQQDYGGIWFTPGPYYDGDSGWIGWTP